jgi:hypothetical protein
MLLTRPDSWGFGGHHRPSWSPGDQLHPVSSSGFNQGCGREPTSSTSSHLVQMTLPVGRDPPGGSGNRLVGGMRRWRSKIGGINHRIGLVIPEPLLPRLEALGDGVPCRTSMSRRVLAGRRVAAADMTTECTTAKMQPPSLLLRALNAAIASGRYRGIDQLTWHWSFSILEPGLAARELWRALAPSAGAIGRSNEDLDSPLLRGAGA